uniref:Peptidase M24 domain-containing protein n=1 Tax=Biomphalaria glabrata TaxID=6526 RepID=A0A2C9L540_BIOGL
MALEKVKPFIKEGISEKELDAKLEYEIRMLGAEKSSFDAIIASGYRGALPHGRASNKIIKNGELITFDFGAIYNGYCSDITRTLHVGEVTDPKLLEIEAVLIEAQRLGKLAVKPGVSTFEVDKVCRDYISEKGYGKYFTHSTGHGLGIEVHEAPGVSFNKSVETILEPGMVITVEPGIYIEGFGGIRIEDDILVTENGHEVLSSI